LIHFSIIADKVQGVVIWSQLMWTLGRMVHGHLVANVMVIWPD
jgi:hypothetical protein